VSEIARLKGNLVEGIVRVYRMVDKVATASRKQYRITIDCQWS